MRRGRPTTGSQGHSAKPSPSPMRGTTADPFAALDGKSPQAQGDELSSRFPSLDQFSLLHDGGKFDFDSSSPTVPPQRGLDRRVTDKLADDAFAVSQSRSPASSATPSSSTSAVSRAQKIISSNPELQSVTSPPSVVYQPTPKQAPSNSYVSTGTMTSPTPPIVCTFPPASDRHRSTSLPRSPEAIPSRSPHLHPNTSPSIQTGAIPPVSQKSPYRPQFNHVRQPSSSRPSLEGRGPVDEVPDPVVRAKSSNGQTRPPNTYLESNIDYLREKESSGRSSTEKRLSYNKEADPPFDEDTNIQSNVQFLRQMEDQETSKKGRRRSSGTNGKTKRSSLPSMSLSGTKTLLAGKFGDAFKRFENNASAPPGPRTPSPLHEMERRDLTPIAGSEATDGRSDDGNVIDDNLNQEQRREVERRRLSVEEKRVADAAAEYRKQLADRGPAPRSIGGVSRASTIQNKLKTLLDESSRSSPAKKTAEGYGRFTESMSAPPPDQFSPSNPYAKPAARQPVMPGLTHGRGLPSQGDINYSKPRPQPIPTPTTASKTGAPRPSAPPKPMHLNNINTGPQGSPPKPTSLPLQARPDMTQQEKEDYIVDFSKRFPSLSGIEMVEREIELDTSKRGDGRSRSRVV